MDLKSSSVWKSHSRPACKPLQRQAAASPAKPSPFCSAKACYMQTQAEVNASCSTIPPGFHANRRVLHLGPISVLVNDDVFIYNIVSQDPHDYMGMVTMISG